MIRRVSRRELLQLALVSPALGTLGCDCEPSLPDVRPSFPQMAGAQEIGRWVLAEHGSRSKRELWREAFGHQGPTGMTDAGPSELRGHFLQRVRRDFEREHTVQANQWLLSRSEAALFAYLSVSYPPQTSAPASQAPASPSRQQLVRRGGQVYLQAGCAACHDLQEDRPTGPALSGRSGKQVTLSDGRRVVRDEAYLRRSLLEPASDVVHGYTPSMPKANLGDDEVDALVAYLRSLSRG